LKIPSTGVCATIVAACLGLTTFAPTATYAAQVNIGPFARAHASGSQIVAQASSAPAAMSSAPAMIAPPSSALPAPASPPPAAPATVTPVTATPMPVEEYGNPPSGEIPILFNDHHVYAKPDHLSGNRVLAAIIRGNVILVPMRSMFEMMGATVKYDAASKTIDVTKPGSDVRVTVGKPEVFINNESRPLDVPPMLYRGSVLVPLRVLSEGMGAYVQWVPDRRIVVVRFVSAPVPQAPVAPPTPTPAPPVASTPIPVATATAAIKVKSAYEKFVVGDYIFSPKVYNELSPGNSGSSSFRAVAAVEFPLFNLPWMLEGDFRSFRYPHDGTGGAACPTQQQGCITAIGHQGQVYAPSFQARSDDFDGRFGLKVADPRIYIGVGYLFRNTNYEGGAEPTQQHGVGFGVEKLPDLDEPFSIYGSVYYFPVVETNSGQDFGNGSFGSVQYRVLKYALGGTFDFGNSPIYIDLGYLGERSNVKQNASIGENYAGPYAGLGIHF
jgi:hypothetical protein